MSDSENLKSLFRFIVPFKKIVFNLAITQIILSLFGVLGPWVSKMLIDNVFASRDYNTLKVLIIVVIALFVFEKCVHVLKSYYEIHIGQKLTFNIRKHVFNHVQSLELSFFESNKTGEVVHRTINDVDAVSGFLNGTVVGIGIDAFMLVVNLALLLYLSPVLTGFAMLFVIPIVALILGFTEISKKFSKQSGEKVSDIYGYLYEVYSGVRTIKILSQEKLFGSIFYRKIIELIRINVKSGFWGTVYDVIYSTVQYSGHIFVMGYGTVMIFEGKFTPGSLIAFISYYYGVLGPVYGLLNMYQSVHNSLPALNRLYHVLNQTKEINEDQRKWAPDVLRGHIQFKQVAFQYPTAQNYALEDICVEINPGESAALVGSSGAGKTTFVSLIPGFYTASRGEILLDGVNINGLDKVFVRKNIGMVLQEPFLISETIMRNILLGRFNATREEVIQAAKDANIHDTIMSLPDQYRTVLGERGVGLSVGEKQRITIARAILKDPKILILDEPTSSVDSLSELLIRQALEKFMKNRTTIIIAHRLSTILHTNKILVFNKGKILGIGSHAELLKGNEFYRSLYHAQFGQKGESDRGKKSENDGSKKKTVLKK